MDIVHEYEYYMWICTHSLPNVMLMLIKTGQGKKDWEAYESQV